MEESQLTIALAAVQSALPKIDKGQTAKVPTKNGGEYSYKYADLATISAEVFPLLSTNGLAWTVLPTIDDGGHFVLRYELRHIGGEVLTGSYPMPSASSKPQEIGSAMTYARRYCLCSVVGLVPDEDDDGAAAGQAAPGAPRRGRQSPMREEPSYTALQFEVKRQVEALSPQQTQGYRAWRDEKKFPTVNKLSDAQANEALDWIGLLEAEAPS